MTWFNASRTSWSGLDGGWRCDWHQGRGGHYRSVVARAQGNYVSLQAVSQDFDMRFPGRTSAWFPILSRNHFAMILKAIAQAKFERLTLNYPQTKWAITSCPWKHSMRLAWTPGGTSRGTFRERFGGHCIPSGIGTSVHQEIMAAEGGNAMWSEQPPSGDSAHTTDPGLRYPQPGAHQARSARQVHSCWAWMNNRKAAGSGTTAIRPAGCNKAGDALLKLFPRDVRRWWRHQAEFCGVPAGWWK